MSLKNKIFSIMWTPIAVLVGVPLHLLYDHLERRADKRAKEAAEKRKSRVGYNNDVRKP
jgi:hypothetical protein